MGIHGFTWMLVPGHSSYERTQESTPIYQSLNELLLLALPQWQSLSLPLTFGPGHPLTSRHGANINGPTGQHLRRNPTGAGHRAPIRGCPCPGNPCVPLSHGGHQLELRWLNGVPLTVRSLQGASGEQRGAARALGLQGHAARLEGWLEYAHRIPDNRQQGKLRILTRPSGTSALHLPHQNSTTGHLPGIAL